MNKLKTYFGYVRNDVADFLSKITRPVRRLYWSFMCAFLYALDTKYARITFTAILDLLGYAYQGWVVSLMWRWFIAPLGVKPIGVFWGIALSYLAQLLIEKPYEDDERKAETYADFVSSRIVNRLVRPTTTLIFGFLAH